MFEAHALFHEPADSATVWRYMDLARFISLATTASLYFTRSDKMTDRWEGEFGAANEQAARDTYGAGYSPEIWKARRNERQAARARINLNCWHVSEIESAAMWDIYQREGRGVALRTTWGDLKSSVIDPWQIFGCLVTYADHRTAVIDESNLYSAFLTKRLAYQHEHEARLVFNSATLELPGTDVKQTRDVGALKCPPGYTVEIDLALLNGSLRVAPTEPVWVLAAVRALIEQLGTPITATQSELADLP